MQSLIPKPIGKAFTLHLTWALVFSVNTHIQLNEDALGAHTLEVEDRQFMTTS